MNTTTWMAAAIAGATVAIAPATPAQAQEKPGAAAASTATAQRTFATPQDGVKALVDAVRAGSAKGIRDVMGPSSTSWLFSGDNVADRADWKRFLDAYDKKNSITTEGDAKAVLNAGNGDWPFPAPIVKHGDKLGVRRNAGREEVLNRRVGRNELDTMQTLLAIVDAQREYAASERGNGLADYASVPVAPGKKDGLYWPTKAGKPPSPLGPLVARRRRRATGRRQGRQSAGVSRLSLQAC